MKLAFNTDRSCAFFVLLAAVIVFACTSCTKPKGMVDDDPASKFRMGKPYQALYTMPPGAFFPQQKIYWDGKAKIRMDNIGGVAYEVPNTVSVLDLDKSELIVWQEGMGLENVYKRRPATETDPLMIMARPYMKAGPDDSLGARNVDGHACHGWKSKLDPSVEMWLDDKLGCIVEMNNGGRGMVLTKLESAAPSPTMFEPPAGYILDRQSGAGKGQKNY